MQFEQKNADTIYAERTVLGMVLTENVVLMGDCLPLRPEHFMLGSHRVVYSVCLELAGKGEFDLRDVRKALGSDVEALGGTAWLASLTDGIFRSTNAAAYVREIIDAWRGRKGAAVCEAALTSFSAGESAVDVLAALQTGVMDVIADAEVQDDPLVGVYSDEALADLLERSQLYGSAGLSFGMAALDSWTAGMQPGQVTVIGARSGVGKTSLMRQATAANCKVGVPVTLFSLEASRQEVLEGLWAIVSGVESRKITRPWLLNAIERDRLSLACKEVKGWNLRIYDKADIPLEQIVSLARLNVRQFGVKLVCVDYAQTVSADGRDDRTRVANVSSKLTKMAKAEKCHLMLLSQLRKVTNAENIKPPTVLDLRETAQLENDAHMIVLLHRPWDEEKNQASEEASVIIGKTRRGKTGALAAIFREQDLTFQGRP